MSLPIENCYWVIPEKLLAGEYPRNRDEESSETKINALLQVGITVFIDLTEENEGLYPYSHLIGLAAHHRFPVKDLSLPDSPEAMVEILNTIDHCLSQGSMVYVHCWGGVGRTGTVIGCWLARHNVGGKPALERLHELWKQCPKSQFRQTPETAEQEQCILRWELGH